jgi:hypothetical protein
LLFCANYLRLAANHGTMRRQGRRLSLASLLKRLDKVISAGKPRTGMIGNKNAAASKAKQRPTRCRSLFLARHRNLLMICVLIRADGGTAGYRSSRTDLGDKPLAQFQQERVDPV